MNAPRTSQLSKLLEFALFQTQVFSYIHITKMKFVILFIASLTATAVALPTIKARHGSMDESIEYPDEKLYAEEYKRAPITGDEKVEYPDEKLYAEEYKRAPAVADEKVEYPDEKLYAEEYKRTPVMGDEKVEYPDEKLYAEEY
ncbi:unnamed protein product [Periconia digitata]|uniref:Uncharacterized protein n=1 Tax=Periconia digitata TaxID=1303443 RepID=A0A9W4UIH7_9PLEO|nr:unnamed protein product [Periconia digitata]